MERREFLKTSGAIVVCACAGSSTSACKMISGVSDTPTAPSGSYQVSDSEVMLDLNKVSVLDKVGASIKIEIENEKHHPLKIIVARVGSSEYIAFSNKCTHGERELEYEHNSRSFTCVSFGHSKFDIKGVVLDGPAEKPVQLFPVSLSDNKLQIIV